MAAEPPLRLKDWLVAQVESGRYPGLRWEDRERKLFRIPWKHAAKQDYQQQQDAALFKAWAVYKGRYEAGQDKPSVWKTRLRCALNKSSDFKEVPERSHLDTSEPYKVYRIVSEHPSSLETDKEDTKEPQAESNRPSTSAPQEKIAEGRAETAGQPSGSGQESKEEPVGISPVTSTLGSQASQMPNHAEHQGCQVKGFFYGWNPAQFRCHWSPPFVGPSSQYTDAENIMSDCWLHIRLFYCDVLVKEVTTSTAEGCRITSSPVHTDNTHLYGPSGVEQIQLPSPGILAGNSQVRGTVHILEQLLPHLHRGVLLWVAPEGVFVKRQCQGRVYWKGPLAPDSDQPNKLEREKTYKLLDTQQFLQQLRGYLSHGEPPPQYQIRLCFGEEYPPAPKQKLHKFIMAHVEPVFARDLFLHAQQLGPRSLQDSQVWSSDAPRNVIRILKQLCSP
uniref:Interferon regulatory factor 4-like n=1 Tax=Pogona vitticeps TaxID=103695 RepID=A0ABM5G4Y5_9SAUR